jgi:alpha-glucosidase
MDLSWSLGTIVYHIYVRSFQDSNDDGVGDLNGLLTRLEYIASLGVSAIWLSPIYPSPQADFGYDVANYTDIDPIYGSLEVFDKFLAACHSRGLRVMMDFVPNHTSLRHQWFIQSKSSKNNPKRDWYMWRAKKTDGSLPNNWLSVFGGTAWEWDEQTQEYYLHTFDKGQPDLNWRNPEVVEAMLSVLRFWLDRGVDGFRVDVPYHMFKHAELLDEPASPNYRPELHGQYESLLHVHTAWLPESFDMMGKFVEVLKEYEHKFMVSEAWGTLEDLLTLYKTVGWKYFAPFNFSFITLPWQAELHKQFIDSYDKALGDIYFPCFVLGNHDKPRVVSRIGEKQARIAAIAALSLRGIPFIYYGEEIGMSDTPLSPDDVQDPFEKLSPGLGLGRDPQRTPEQWNGSTNAGFSNAKPWLPVNMNYQIVNIEKEAANKTSMYNLYLLLIKLRKHHPSLREGSYVPVESPAENVFTYIREHKDEKALIILNFDNKGKHISLPYEDAHVIASASLTIPEGERIDVKNLQLSGDEGLICTIQ